MAGPPETSRNNLRAEKDINQFGSLSGPIDFPSCPSSKFSSEMGSLISTIYSALDVETTKATEEDLGDDKLSLLKHLANCVANLGDIVVEEKEDCAEFLSDVDKVNDLLDKSESADLADSQLIKDIIEMIHFVAPALERFSNEVNEDKTQTELRDLIATGLRTLCAKIPSEQVK